jgi:hypothetical protein
MALVICDMSISLDGFVTGPNDSRRNPFGDGAGMLHNAPVHHAGLGDNPRMHQRAGDPAATHLGVRVVR